MKQNDQPRTKYGVEIKLDSERGSRNTRGTVHVECLDISQVLAVLDDREGEVRIFDRQKQDLVFDGGVAELRHLLRSSAMCQGENTQEFTACCSLVAS